MQELGFILEFMMMVVVVVIVVMVKGDDGMNRINLSLSPFVMVFSVLHRAWKGYCFGLLFNRKFTIALYEHTTVKW